MARKSTRSQSKSTARRRSSPAPAGAAEAPGESASTAISLESVAVPADVAAAFGPPPPFRPEGEVIGDLGTNYAVVPFGKWADTSLFEGAAAHAEEVLRKTTIDPRVSFGPGTILCQEYYDSDRIVFIFAHWARPRRFGALAAQWCYCPIVLKLTAPLKAHMVLTGRWPSTTRH